MRVACERAEDGAVVTAGGRLTASQAGHLQRQLLEAFAGARRVELSLNGVQETDLSFLQLLCASHRTAAARGVAFLVSGLESAEPVVRLIHEAGADRGVGCPAGCRWPDGAAAGCGAEPKG